MLNNVIDFTYSQARYELLKELDERGVIGRLLLLKEPRLAQMLSEVCEQIEFHHGQLEKFNTDPTYVFKDWRCNDKFVFMFQLMNEFMPYFILCHSEYNWNEFLSAWLKILSEYIEIHRNITQIHDERENLDEESKSFISDNMNILKDLSESMTATLNLLDIGIGYTHLIQATDYIIQELSLQRQANPNPVRLSMAYLQSLGFNN